MSFPRIRLANTADMPALAYIKAQAATLLPASRIPQGGPGVPEVDFTQGVASGLLWVAEAPNAEDVAGFLLAREEGGACTSRRWMWCRLMHAKDGDGACGSGL